jgi:hypothetical protein
VSALKPEIGDRYRLGDDEWQVVAFEAGFKAAGPRSDHRARLARVDGGRGAKRAKIEDLLVGSWVYLGNSPRLADPASRSRRAVTGPRLRRWPRREGR